MFKIIRPALLLDKQKCISNIDKIVNKAAQNKVLLRPHFKTHQSIEVARWFRERGVSSCTVSSLEMAEYFSEDNWNDITVAFPINILEVDLINRLAAKIKLNLLVSTSGVLPQLLKKLNSSIGVYIDIDTGYHRTGIDPLDVTQLERIMEEIESSSMLLIEGFLSHAGHTYKCNSKSEIEFIYNSESLLLNELKNKYRKRFPNLKLSVGDTPSASLLDNFSSIDEIRAGNLVFYDLTQAKIGSCKIDEIAVALVCPVVAVYPERNEIIIYGGGVHFSKDFLLAEDGKPSYGAVVMLSEEGWMLPPTSMFVKSLSQEHGIIHASSDEIYKIKPGDLLGILPVHSCLTADAMDCYYLATGERIEKLN